MKDKAKPGKLVIAKIVKGNISKEQAEKLKKLADERDTSQGAIIRQWIENEKTKSEND